ncbi:MAG: hypothetical protein J6Y60_11415 [Treponema sp.]|nr:hypothetical protein [Treponema sp.]
MAKRKNADGHAWHFVQTGGLMQVDFKSVDDVLNLDKLDQKLWVALACPVSGLEFSDETLQILDIDKDGRVRVPEILAAVDYIKKYFKKPEVIMEEGDTIPLDALGDEAFDCGHSPAESAASILHILEKDSATEIGFDDISVNDRLFSPTVFNGDKVLPAEVVHDETACNVVKEIIEATGGCDDISGVKGINREQFEIFFNDVQAIHDWREMAQKDAPGIFFLNFGTDAAFKSYSDVKEKIDEFFLRCSVDSYSDDLSKKLEERDLDSMQDGLDKENLSLLPIASINKDKKLPLKKGINPMWAEKIKAFTEQVVSQIFDSNKESLSELEWKKIKDDFDPYSAWFSAKPDNSASSLSFERVDEILSSDARQIIDHNLSEEEKHPPVALATVDLKKMLLLRRDFLKLLKNYVSFKEFYDPDLMAIFQCGVLYIDGHSCDLCFKVTDAAKHASMSPLSQCYLLYCDCTQKATGKTMQIAAMVSAGKTENLMPGRNGLFYDREGNDWDAVITKIVENPTSIKEAFWSPYKKLARFVQEKVTKMASDAENKVSDKMSATVDHPAEAATNAAAATSKKIDIGTIAAISVAFTGIATVVGGLMQAFLGLGAWIPLGILGIILLISLPSMFIAWNKLRQRNIAPILDASGWAINGNVKISLKLGNTMTQTASCPKGSTLNPYDPFEQKGFPIKRVIFAVVIVAIVVLALVLIIKNPNGIVGVWENIKGFFGKFMVKATETVENAVPAAS